MPVDFKHKEYRAHIESWNSIDDVVNKTNLDKHLRELNPSDTSGDNKARNKAYKMFAVFYNFTGYTLNGLVGELYSKSPDIELPAGLEYLNENSDGHGNSITQSSQATSRETTKKGRAGLFTSFPFQTDAVSRADIQRGVRAIITPIDASRIINWEESTINGAHKLTLVVMSETMTVDSDGFGGEDELIYRELRIGDAQTEAGDIRTGVYIDRKWKLNKIDNKWEIFEEKIPLDGTGQPWDVLPFKFCGSQNNDSSVDNVNMDDLADINLAHYRNSADYEDSVWHSGQSQPWMSGVDDNHLKILQNNDIYTGGRSLMPVPAGETFAYATAEPSPLVRQAMLDKIENAKGLGARFIMPGGVAKTAEQSGGENAVAHSVLGLIGENVGQAYEDSIKFVGRYMNVDAENVKFELNKEFVPTTATSADLKEMVAGWMSGAIPQSDYIRWMQSIDRIDPDKSLEDVNEELSRGNV